MMQENDDLAHEPLDASKALIERHLQPRDSSHAYGGAHAYYFLTSKLRRQVFLRSIFASFASRLVYPSCYGRNYGHGCECHSSR